MDWWIDGIAAVPILQHSNTPVLQQSNLARMPLVLIDTHVHLQLEQFDADRAAVIGRAVAAGVTRMITIATDLASSRQGIALAETHDELFAAVGIHPNDCVNAADADYEELRELARHPRVVAIGEIGLDYYWNAAPPEAQRRAFVRQLALARELQKPVIIHNREAGAAILQTLADEGIGGLRGVFHCFSEDAAYARHVLELGCHLSFTGNLTYKKSVLPEVAVEIPLDRLLLETDAPFMSPVPHRGKRNEPAFVVHVAEMLAAIKKKPEDEIANITTMNARRLFGMGE